MPCVAPERLPPSLCAFLCPPCRRCCCPSALALLVGPYLTSLHLPRSFAWALSVRFAVSAVASLPRRQVQRHRACPASLHQTDLQQHARVHHARALKTPASPAAASRSLAFWRWRHITDRDSPIVALRRSSSFSKGYTQAGAEHGCVREWQNSWRSWRERWCAV